MGRVVALLALLLFAASASALDTSLASIRVPDRGSDPGAGGVLGLTGEGVVIAVLDTGVDDGHPSLEGSYVAGAEVLLGVGGGAPTVTERNPEDGQGHGTHVANVALGRGLSDGSIRGVAPAARLVDVRVGSDAGGISIGGLEAGLDWVLKYNRGETGYGDPGEDRVDVVSVSHVTAEPGSDAGDLAEKVAELVAEGVVVVVAAGNCGPEADPECTREGGDTITSPGAAADAVTVAAVDDRGTADASDDTVAAFSSRGPNGAVTLTRPKPDVAAPGVAIESAWPGGGSAVMDGTSQAAPHVAGLAALLLEAKPSLTPAQVRDALVETARDLGVAGWDGETGAGEVDAYAAARRVLGGNRAPVAVATPDRTEAAVGDEVTFRADGSRDPDGLVVTYLWNLTGIPDAAGSVLTARAERAGDLVARLTVTDADGATATATAVVRVEAPREDAEPPPPTDPGDPPFAQIVAEPTGAVVGETVTFDGTGSGGGRPLVSHSWDFDEDGAEDARGPVVRRAFDQARVVRANLTVEDDVGRRAWTVRVLVVSEPPEEPPLEDTGPPAVRILRPEPGARVDSPVLAEWVATDDAGVSTVLLLVDALQREVAAEGARELELAPGAHVVRVEATDAAGRTGFDQVAFVVLAPKVDDGALRVNETPTRPVPSPAWIAAAAAFAAVALRRR